MTDDEVTLVNCHMCGDELIGPKTFKKLIGTPRSEWPAVCKDLGRVAGRILGFSHCYQCLIVRPAKGLGPPVREDNPSLDNARRALEGD